jgi:hypothetical protein
MSDDTVIEGIIKINSTAFYKNEDDFNRALDSELTRLRKDLFDEYKRLNS